MGWKGKQAFVGGGFLLGAIGLVVLAIGYVIAPGSAFDAQGVYWSNAMSVIGSVLIAGGVVTLVVSRMRDFS